MILQFCISFVFSDYKVIKKKNKGIISCEQKLDKTTNNRNHPQRIQIMKLLDPENNKTSLSTLKRIKVKNLHIRYYKNVN